MEKVDDDIPMQEAIGLYEPNKILSAANEVLTKLGQPDLVEKITNEVLESENPKKIKKDKKHQDSQKISDL